MSLKGTSCKHYAKGNNNVRMESNKVITGVACDNYSDIPAMPQNPQYAFAYIKFQQYGDLFTPENALMCGTYFKDLSMPYNQCCKGEKNGNCK